MQHIGLQLEDEDRKVIETSPSNFADSLSVLYENQDFKTQYPWLSTIDPYGDTVFNGLQIPYVISELNFLISKIPSKDTEI